jgi:hypothetical protein
LCELDELPRQAVLVEICHEGVGVVLLDVPDAGLGPAAGEHLFRADHGGDAGGVGDGLGSDLREAGLVVADVVDVDCFGRSVFDAGDHVADAGPAFGGLAEVAGVGQDGFEKLEGHNFHAVVFHFVDAGHADVLEHLQVVDVIL